MMAAARNSLGFVCSCFFTNNIFVKKYNLHVSFIDKNQFMDDYSRILRNKGCVTEKQFENVLCEIEAEVSRRKQLGSTSLKRSAEIQEKYVPLHTEVYSLKESFLDPQFLSLVSAARNVGESVSIDDLKPHMECLGDEVYTFPVFSQQFCQLLLQELDNIESSDCPKGRPNTMNQYGVLLNEFNFNPGLLTPLRENYLLPLTSILYPTWGGHSLDSNKAFTVHYQPDLDRDLSCHFDNAEITLNVALGRDNFTGGDLYFLNMNNEVDPPHKTSPLKCGHRPGWGILHRGQHRHGAEAVTSGKRVNLIMWMRSSCVRNERCPMCGEVPSLMRVPGLDDGFRDQPPPDPQVVDMCQTL